MADFNVNIGGSPQVNCDTGGISQKYAEETYEKKTNKTTEISSASTDEQYPSAKAVYDIINDLKPDMVKRIVIDMSSQNADDEIMKLGFDIEGTVFMVCEVTPNKMQPNYSQETYYYMICIPTKHIPLMGRLTDNYYQIKLTNTQIYVRTVTRGESAMTETAEYEATEWETYPNKVSYATMADQATTAQKALFDGDGEAITSKYATKTEFKQLETSMQVKCTVVDLDDESQSSMPNNFIFNFGEKTAITVTIPATTANDYISGFTFISGETPTSITVPTEIKFSGTDCFDGSFTPTSNKAYQVIISRVGSELWGDVDARDYTVETEETA